ncbi:bifunctional NAD(P)H-dependent oxidoreductase/GNAT family N-acetyltransferase [Yinghuangia soli]|uniref:Bifunctional NAD(P)H-dependent oxidoreductase/GNAT family N-acetyltransferase n=1 Tax=Yinghuangia soli TaxID=2908204 RepID=A0AA41Q8V0_9ACTN|nr:bifunctional NAD(P)H-dependent oxidoreductase/GNAT family N-acetyltransferase [Yinghuangia soli]MCF2532479.1 bifunctional NAD(P)H-dependent oxidoreductase/GNAT family N-acetyltransferase [Yinghuangia soli]
MFTKSPLRVMVLTSSTRPGAIGPAIADWFAEAVGPLAATLGAELHPVSLSELALPFLDEGEHPSSGIYRHEHTKEWSGLVDAADGFVVVTPEYNYGMPASLKNALDYLHREWAWKPMGFVSYGNTSAGTRSVQHTKEVATTLRLVPLGATVALRLDEAIDGGRVRPTPRLTAAAEGVLRELVRLSHALRPMREALREDNTAGPVAGSYVRELNPDDAPEATVLQRCCWVDEAVDNASLDLAPLRESVDDVAQWLSEWTVAGLWRDGRLIGMVRVRHDGDTGHIGRLAVAPDMRGTGIGRWLLRHARQALTPTCTRIALSTGVGSVRNIALYQSEGFVADGSGAEGIVHLSKAIPDHTLIGAGHEPLAG